MNEGVPTKGRVKKTTVRHFPNCSNSTEIELEDGTIIEYSDVAPIPRGHVVTCVGQWTTLTAALEDYHGPFLQSRGGIQRWLMSRRFEDEFGRSASVEVLKSDEIEDEETGVRYKEHR